MSSPKPSSSIVPAPAGALHPEGFWRSLLYFNFYRLVLAGVALLTVVSFRDAQFGDHHPRLFLYAAIGYALLSAVSLLLIRLRWPRFNWQLAIQVGGDVLCLMLLTYSSGGIQSGLGLLLLTSLAAAGMVSRGRLALFFASVATIALLLEETYAVLHIDAYAPQYVQAALLSLAYFATAWLAHQLAKSAAASERLARERGIDLANMAQVNQLVIRDMQDGVLVVDEAGSIRQRNSQASHFLGLPPASPAGTAAKDEAQGLRLSDCAPELAERLALWRDNEHADFELLRLGVGHAMVRTRFMPVNANRQRDQVGQAWKPRGGVVIFLEDMSRAAAQAQQLKLAALGRLTANIAHEIRNPLSAISHAAELMEEEPAATVTQAKLMRIIRDNTERLNKMVRDVLELNRRDHAAPETFGAADFLRTFAADFCYAEQIEPASLLLQADGNPAVHFDRGHLNQILWNLCRNAWRHGRKQPGSVVLRATLAAGRGLCLDVIDDGPGVSAEQRGQLFEPFFTTAAGGTGLGLYIAREMCEANGASLEYRPQTEGACFRIVCKQ